MGKYYVDVEKANSQVTHLRNHKTSLTARRSSLMDVHDELWIGVETESIREAIEKLDTNLRLEANEVELLANTLDSIIKLYVAAENNTLNHINGGQTITAPNNNPGGNNGNGSNTPANDDETPEKPEKPEAPEDEEPFNVYKWLEEQTGIPQDVLEIIGFILSFIPVVNCVTDIIDLVNDISAAKADGKITLGEALTILSDGIFAVLDFKAAINIAKGVVKAAKAANTAAKHADDVAKETKKVADKAIDKANDARKAADKAHDTEKATKTARDATSARKATDPKNARAAEKGYNKAVKKAEQAEKSARKAEKAADKAKKVAKDAEKTAKDIERGTDAAKRVAKEEMEKGTRKNLSDPEGIARKTFMHDTGMDMYPNDYYDLETGEFVME